MNPTLELLSDINKVIDRIEDEVDAYLATLQAGEIFSAKREKVLVEAKKMAKKYGGH